MSRIILFLEDWLTCVPSSRSLYRMLTMIICNYLVIRHFRKSTMITSSAGSPGFIPLAPKRLKPKTSLSAQTSPAKQERIVESSPSPPGAARQIESLLNSRSRLHLSYNRNTAPLLGGIGEDDWSKFSEDFLANFCAEGAPTNDQSKRPISITRDDGVHSFYAVGSSGSSSNTVQLSTEETMLPKTPSSPRLSARNFLRRRPPSYPSGGSSTRRDSYDQPPGSPTSSLASIKSSKLSRCEDHRVRFRITEHDIKFEFANQIIGKFRKR